MEAASDNSGLGPVAVEGLPQLVTSGAELSSLEGLYRLPDRGAVKGDELQHALYSVTAIAVRRERGWRSTGR